MKQFKIVIEIALSQEEAELFDRGLQTLAYETSDEFTFERIKHLMKRLNKVQKEAQTASDFYGQKYIH